MLDSSFSTRQFTKVVLITSIWINASEVFRYFLLVMPRVKAYWNDLESVAQMNMGIFAIWGIWDTILTALIVFSFWLFSRVYGNNLRSVFISGILSWVFFFVLYWVGAANMGYSDWSMLGITLPLSLFEVVVANVIASVLYKKYDRTVPLMERYG